ncbi:hypothetical protein QJS10_CPA16g00916 [Acorus calamus]|uniref:Uncharacterized protein n=1 Tax=Acorus calamus TaxID=4465 RepID=A0AAV9D0V0_ACOCL|nr:hypothetical protein QJS10_CPA16g00916 [Acorus calamus]
MRFRRRIRRNPNPVVPAAAASAHLARSGLPLPGSHPVVGRRLRSRRQPAPKPGAPPLGGSPLEGDAGDSCRRVPALPRWGRRGRRNCLFTASRRAMGTKIDARELRHRTVKRFLEDFAGESSSAAADAAIRHMYSPDLRAGWGVHVVQEVKLLARKSDRAALDAAIEELVGLSLQREVAAESIYKERCVSIEDVQSWGKYMSVSGSSEDEHDIITLLYTEEGLLTVDENREGRVAAFGMILRSRALQLSSSEKSMSFRCMDPTQWWMRKIVFSSFRIVLGVISASHRSFSS